MSESIRSERHEQLRSILKERRIEAGLTQAELSARLGKPQSFIAKIETAERRVGVLDALDIYVALGGDARDLADDLERLTTP
ncbi:multiprotein-bridging factor 1 family protein [Oceanicaulis sp. LC35]|uniref:helix-turn-helix domain-containing protein n=1 Tax=Oceanicaulis sp. LC35 TaxID=3349635 RepID=UPI003F84658D